MVAHVVEHAYGVHAPALVHPRGKVHIVGGRRAAHQRPVAGLGPHVDLLPDAFFADGQHRPADLGAVFVEPAGEGKLEGTRDNHLYYHLGLVLRALGREQEAENCFRTAATGTDEPAGAMYYNDQPADMILYQGLSFLELGKIREARARFYRLIDYGERHLTEKVKIGYFAVSLPEFRIFDEDLTARNKAHCYYLMALGHLGLGEKDKAVEFLNKALETDPSHMMAQIYLDETEE